ncbi:MAG: PAS domain S-box protein [archaeon]
MEKKSQYKQILNHSSDLIATINHSYRYLFINQRYREYYKLKKDQIIGKTIGKVIGKKDFFKIKPRIDRCLAGENVSFQMIRNFPRFKKRTISVNYYPLLRNKRKENGVIVIIRDITSDHRKSEEKKDSALYDLVERNKELNLLYKISKVSIKNRTIEEILQKTVKFLPNAWRYPEITCARINYLNDEFKTNNFRSTNWKQQAPINILGKKKGEIEVYYLEKKPESYEGPFLKEERSLLNTAARLFSNIIENKEAVKKLKQSEKRFRTITENIPNGLIHIFNTDFQNVYTAGDYELEKLKLKKRDLEGKTIYDLFEPEDAQYVEKYLKECLETKEIVSFEGSFRARTFLVNAIPLLNGDGKVNYILALSLDISERKRAEKLLRESEKQFRRAILELPFPIMLHAEDGEVLIVNEVWTEITGYTLEDIPTISDWTGKAYGEHKFIVEETIQNLFDIDKRVDEGIFKVQTKDGEQRLWNFSSVPIGKLNDERNIVLSAALDITERKKAQEKLKKSEKKYRKLAEKLEEKVRERTKTLQKANIKLKKYLDKLAKESQFKTEFLSSVSHELRTPLNSIIGFSELLLEEYANELKSLHKEYLQNIYESSGQLLGLINRIIDLSQIETGKLELKITEFSLENIVTQTISIIKPLYKQKNLEFELIEEYNKDKKIKADPSRLKQILFNLLSNAVKFTNEGKISLKVAEKSGEWRFEVADTGIGIKKEDYPTLFQEFGRIDNTDLIEGTGLGLPLVKRLVELHGGEIDFQSEYGKGTTFYVSIPK